jgi:hypothetical protein
MLARPLGSIPRKDWADPDAIMALTAFLRPPSVQFLNPTGMERPDAISRWIWLSVVRAPMAVQETRPAIYWGVNGIEHLRPRGEAHFRDIHEKFAGFSNAGHHIIGAVQIGIIDHALPTDGRPGFFEIDPHDHHQGFFNLFSKPVQAWHNPDAAASSWMEQGPPPPSVVCPPFFRIRWISSRLFKPFHSALRRWEILPLIYPGRQAGLNESMLMS